MHKESILNVPVSEIGWIDPITQGGERKESFGDPIGDTEAAFPPLYAENGHDIGQGIAACYVGTEADKLAVIEERKKQYAKYKDDSKEYVLFRVENDKGVTDTKVKGSEIAAYMIDPKGFGWVDAKGNWLKPKYIAVTLNRRGYASPASQMAYQRFNNDPSLVLTFPCHVREMTTEKEKFFTRIKENDQKGRIGYSLVEKLMIVIKCIGFGLNETNAVRHLGDTARGTGQKLFSWGLVCVNFPELELAARAAMDKPKVDETTKKFKYERGGWYDLKTVDPKDARTLLGKAGKEDTKSAAQNAEALSDRAVKAMGGDVLKKFDMIGKVATNEQVETYISLLFETVTGPKMIEKNTVIAAKDRFINDPSMLEFLTAMVDGKEDKFNAHLNSIKELNVSKADLEKKVVTLQAKVDELEAANKELTETVSKLETKIERSKGKQKV